MSNGYGYRCGGKGRGRGCGIGGGRGQGKGRGRGFGRGQGAISQAGSLPPISEPRDEAPRVQAPKTQAQDMMDQLSAITQRIAEIEATNPPALIKQSKTDLDENRSFRKMIAVIEQKRCINCGLCVDLCPEEAIVMNVNYTVVIDSSKCTGCGSCISECPNEAISLSETARRVAS